MSVMLLFVGYLVLSFAVSQFPPPHVSLPCLVQIRQSPAMPNIIKLNIDLSSACAGISAVAAAAVDGELEASRISAIELLAIGAIVPLTAESWGYELVATFLLPTRTGT